MRNLRNFVWLSISLLFPQLVHADLVGPYTPDANTIVLLHFDEAAGGSASTNVGTLGGNVFTVNEASASTTPPTVSTMLGAAGYMNGAFNFTRCLTNPTAGYLAGYDFNKSGVYQGDVNTTSPSADALSMGNLNIGNGGQKPFTLEALILFRGNLDGNNHEIICTDSSGAPTGGATNRAFQFRISGAVLNFQFIGGPSAQSVSGTIPTTGADAFAAGAWYHVAMVYDGTLGTLYWTKVDPSAGAAHYLNSAPMTLGSACGAVSGPLVIGNENKGSAGEQFLGSIDEVRISSVARGANQMQFFSQTVVITKDPTSQNVDYNQPVIFSASAASLMPIGYQWYFNATAIPLATNASYSIAHVVAANAGSYSVIATNSAGYSATSSPAVLVVGAANFLNHRYSFNGDTSDSIGGAWGTNFGNATVSGGALVLDGSSGTYMQLPANLFSSANASALTLEFWTTIGGNNNNARVFSFGNTVSDTARNYLMFSPHSSIGHEFDASAGDVLFQNQATNANPLDNLSIHLACVIDPLNSTMSIYTNGVLEAANTSMTVGIGSLNDVLSFIGKSLNTADPYFKGSIDEFRIYNGALSPISLQQSDSQGPNIVLADGPARFLTQPTDATVAAGRTATFTASVVGYFPISYQWFKNGTRVSGATNASYSFTAVLGDNSAHLACYATNTVGVTTYITNSTTAILTVFTPPSIAWLGMANGGANNDWDTASLNWINGASKVAFSQTSDVTLDNRGSGSSPVNLVQEISPFNLAVNATSDYLLTSTEGNGSLSGEGHIVKANSGTLIIDVTNNLSGLVIVSGGVLQIGNGDAFGSLGTGSVTNQAILAFNRADTALTVSNSIHGSGLVRYDGTGTVTVFGNSDYAGGTLINAGIVNLKSATGLGGQGSATVVSGGQLYITANTNVAQSLVLSGNGDGNGALRKGGTGTTVCTGTMNLASDTTIGVDSGATLVLSNTISGSGALTMVGNGTLTLNAPSSYTGGTTLTGGSISKQSIINVGDNNALGSGIANIPSGSSSGRFVIASGLSIPNAFRFGSINPGPFLGVLMVNDNTNGSVTTISGAVDFENSQLNGGCFGGPTSSGYLHITGPVRNVVTGVVSSRLGRVRFSGGGDYLILTVNDGVVSLGANDGICTAAMLNMSASAPSVFDLNGFNQTLGGLADAASYGELITNSAATQGILTLNLSSSATYSGAIAGNLSVVQNGAANLVLTGTNTYAGNTTVNGGTMEVAYPSLARNGTITIASGAVLQLDALVTNTVAGLVLNGVSQRPGLYNSVTSYPYLAGAGSLVVASPIPTNPTHLSSMVQNGKLIIDWPADHTGWHLQMQTNPLSKGLDVNWVNVLNTSTINSFTNELNPTNGTVFYRLVYP